MISNLIKFSINIALILKFFNIHYLPIHISIDRM